MTVSHRSYIMLIVLCNGFNGHLVMWLVQAADPKRQTEGERSSSRAITIKSGQEIHMSSGNRGTFYIVDSRMAED